MAEGKKKRSQGKECSFFGCSNRMYDANGKKTRFRFFTFPKDEKLRRIWENRVARKSGNDGFRITKATVVCNVHFRTDDILRVPGGSRLDLRKGAVPLKWNERPKEKEKKRTAPRQRETSLNVNKSPPKSSNQDHSVKKFSTTSEIVQVGNANVDSLRILASKALCKLNNELVEKVKLLTSNEDKSPIFSANNLADDEKCKHYTGFPNYAVFIAVFDLLKPGMNGENVKLVSAPNAHTGRGRRRRLSGKEQFLLTLMRLRRGFSTEHLEWLFRIDKSTVSRIFVSWVNFIYLRLSAIPIWPTREQVDQTMPQTFKDSFPKTRVIIDCTEFYCEAPTSLELKGNMYSDYKGRETYKALVGITPAGSVSFVSQFYYGSLSDREIVERSGLLNPRMFDDGDEIMADKGFNIRDLTDKIGVRLNLPIFLGSRDQFEANETVINQKIASNRIHVERFINKVKKFRLLDRTIPLSLHGSINQLWTVAALLTLFHYPIISA